VIVAVNETPQFELPEEDFQQPVRQERKGATRKRLLRFEYKWSALSSTSLGALLASVNTGTLIIALPDLARSYIGVFSLVWVLLSYMLAQTALVLMVGRFADPASTMASMFSGVSGGLSEGAAVSFISGLHAALLLMAGGSLLGAVFSALRGSEERRVPTDNERVEPARAGRTSAG
jgi:hypothetical protein